jgi:CRP-like cAMP-binding protein
MTATSQNSAIKVQLLRNLVPLNTMSDGNLEILATHARAQRIAPGATLFQRGDTDPTVYYVLEGEVVLTAGDGDERWIAAGTDDARYALAQLKPRQASGKTVTEATILRFADEELDRLLTWDQLGGIEVEEIESGDDSEWMMQVLRNPIFDRLPAANATAMLQRMEAVPVSARQVILRQGDAGDYYYLLREGHCSVARKGPDGKVGVVNQLGPGDQFGEEALISDAPRNATVVMKTDGQLMRLAKQDFLALLEPPLLQWAEPGEVERLLAAGATLLDVRTRDEYARGAVKTSRNLPLLQLHEAFGDLDPTRRYVVYCDTGRRSGVAAFLLNQHGFDVIALKDGLAGLQQRQKAVG